ncbi:hypothetical protein [Mycobacterium sp.]|uniref:hypothetical protein n=1 Tax=Mycobacterium sp. TaxID=1785 RepID=UPI0026145446|nr:hypothetical protein [Mycobacterium sp.]
MPRLTHRQTVSIRYAGAELTITAIQAEELVEDLRNATDSGRELSARLIVALDALRERVRHRPLFKRGDRVFSHYTMGWGTVTVVGQPELVRHAGQETGDTDTWHVVQWDDERQGTSLMNDGGTLGWEHARILPPRVASRNGYGTDPKLVKTTTTTKEQ